MEYPNANVITGEVLLELKNNKDKSVSATGHRPEKLKAPNENRNLAYDLKTNNIKAIAKITYSELEKLILSGKKYFISGGTLGFDTLFFIVVNNLKKKYPHVKNILAVPFINQHVKWSESSIKTYMTMLSKADYVIYVDEIDEYKVRNVKPEIYHPAKMQKRNEFMVDFSIITVACWDGSSGGTGNCVQYAKKCNIIMRIHPKELTVKISNKIVNDNKIILKVAI